MSDVLFVIAFLGLLLIPFIVFAIKKKRGFWFWVGTIATMGIMLGIGELSSKLLTGKTLSSNFWEFSLNDPGSAIVILICMLFAWILLIVHLAWKMIKDRK